MISLVSSPFLVRLTHLMPVGLFLRGKPVYRLDAMRLRGWIAAVGLAAAACGGAKPGPTPTPVAQAPQILCPADVKVGSVTGTSQTVTFSPPTVTGGTAPVTTTCTRSSGDVFPLGATSISCTANDAASRQAACSFNVTLSGFTLGVTKFLAVGDSLTEGQNGLLPKFIDVPNSYPSKLQVLLEATYPGQGVTVINRGVGGQKVYELEALIPGILRTERPQAVLLLIGYNDLTLPCAPGQGATNACDEATDRVAVGVRDCIRRTKESTVGVRHILVSTLTPPGLVGGSRIDRNAILQANARMRTRVATEGGASLIDTHPLFVGHEAEYVSVDGLHLNPAGYQAIADAFFAAIKATVPQTPLPSLANPR
jgi:lysophospholipase L1-like esterase